MEKPACRLRTLAREGLCGVAFCPGCQVFHLKIGYATLHLNPEAFAALCGTVARALARYRGQAEEVPRESAPDEGRPVPGTLH